MTNELLQIALYALENGKRVRAFEDGTKYQPDLEDSVISAIRAHLAAQPAPAEPVAEIYRAHYGGRPQNIGTNDVRRLTDLNNFAPGTKLYARPPAQPSPAVPSLAPLKLAMEHSAWEGTLQLSDALANIDDFAKAAQPAPVPLPDEKLIDDYLADYELMDGEGGCHTPCFAMSMYASRADRDVAMLAEIDRLLIQRDDYKSDLMAMQRERDALREQLALAETVPMALMDKLDDILSNATMSRTDGEIVDAARLALKEAWPAAPVPDENPKCPDCGHRALGVGCDMRVPHRTTQPAPEVKP